MKLTTLALIFISVFNYAQPPLQGDEARETLRFIRLAETRRNLDFSDQKLIVVNEILDQFESERITFGKQERDLKLDLSKETLTEEQASQLLSEYRQLKKNQAELGLRLFDRIQESLTPLETVEFYKFYETFKRKIGKRINMLKQNKRPRKKPAQRPRPY